MGMWVSFSKFASNLAEGNGTEIATYVPYIIYTLTLSEAWIVPDESLKPVQTRQVKLL